METVHEWRRKGEKSTIQICPKCGSKRKSSNGAFMYNGFGDHWTRNEVPCIPVEIKATFIRLSIPLRTK